MIKARYEISAGLLGKESGWDIDTMPIVDFGNVNLAGAGTVRSGFNCFPLVNPAHIFGSPDSMPFENPGGTLAVANGARIVGSGSAPMAVLAGVYVIAVTAAGGVYQPAGTTINVAVRNVVTTAAGAATQLATLNAATHTNFLESLAITAPAERQVVNTGGVVAPSAAAIFNGDVMYAEIVTTGVLNIQGNLLYVMLELM